MVKRIFMFILVLFSVIFFTTGCWDRVEIEERGIVIASAIDLVDKKDDKYTLQLTNQLVIPGRVGTPSEGPSSEKNPYINLSVAGESLSSLNNQMRQMTNQNPFYQHLKVIIISEEVAKEPHLFTNIMDVYVRDYDMRRSTRIVITDGESASASSILDIEPELNPLPGMYIEKLMDGVYDNASAIEPVVLGDLHGDLLMDKSFILPQIELKGNFVEYQNAGVFQGYSNQLIGVLDLEETKGLALLTEKSPGGMLDVYVDGKLVELDMTEFRTNIEIKGQDKANLKASADVEINANIIENFGDESLLNEAYENKLEQQAEERAEQLMKQTIDKLQGDFQVDVLGMSDILYRRHYDLWKEVEDNWERGENYFSQMDIEVSAKVTIERVGASDSLRKQQEEAE
ncbi:Ger(x)C family spore germination protein [Virgibacillus oceani]